MGAGVTRKRRESLMKKNTREKVIHRLGKIEDELNALAILLEKEDEPALIHLHGMINAMQGIMDNTDYVKDM